MIPFATTTITRKQYAAGSRGTDHRWVSGAATSTSILASVQPAEGWQLQKLEEGDRSKRVLLILTESELRTASQGSTGYQADRITYASADYEVKSVGQFDSADLIPHYEALVVKVDEADGAGP